MSFFSILLYLKTAKFLVLRSYPGFTHISPDISTNLLALPTSCTWVALKTPVQTHSALKSQKLTAHNSIPQGLQSTTVRVQLGDKNPRRNTIGFETLWAGNRFLLFLFLFVCLK